MPDQEETTSVSESPLASDLSVELGATLSSVWARYVGARPSESEVDVNGGVIRWTLPGGTSEFEKGMAAREEEREAGQPERTVAGYERETSSAVAKATRRRVRARMSKHDQKTGVATETFILESALKKY
jgi:hypothetical protein